MISKHQQKYLAYLLTKSGGEGVEKLSQSLFNANVDLNPHQVEAALFAIRTPFNKGVLLADEVGLGKTIEAGLVISQYWAEKKRKILVITPASLRKQWSVELEEKFNLNTKVIDAKIYNNDYKNGIINPFNSKSVVIASYHYIARKKEDIRCIDWDLIVIDEAHKLRNSYRASNKIGQALKWATEDRRKILLTATPLQNSLIELFGLTSLIDDKIFGEVSAFRSAYVNNNGDLTDLRARISSFCKRSLRKNVVDFIRYTERKLITITFKSTDEEDKLYNSVSNFLRRDDTYAFPRNQKHLIVMVVRKVMSSSIYALTFTLEVIKKRLVDLYESVEISEDLVAELMEDGLIDTDLLDEIELDDMVPEIKDDAIDIKKLEKEIEEITHLIRWAKSFGIDSKTTHLLKALNQGYAEMAKVGAPRKAVIYTESRRTQMYLKNYLEANGFADKLCIYGGKHSDPKTKEIYANWLKENRLTGHISGSKAIDVRHSILDHFKNEAEILISTESGAEGLNLQFCSMLINFDLPWNPQRIEQRIGRIHRYGQKFDVVVINFLNSKNHADKRIYDLLRYKFSLFEGVFGSSDDVLGSIENVSNLEKRIYEIFQNCRTEKEIEQHFNQLQKELEKEINEKLLKTKKTLFEYFDEDVHNKLKFNYNDTLDSLDFYGKCFWRLTKAILYDLAEFDDKSLSFILNESPEKNIPSGLYFLPNKRKNVERDGIRYSLNTKLGDYCINKARDLEVSTAEIAFDLSAYPLKLTLLNSYKGQSGWILLTLLTIQSVEKEDFLLFNGFTDAGKNLDQETVEKMFRLDTSEIKMTEMPENQKMQLEIDNDIYAKSTARKALENRNSQFQERREMLFRWAEDVVKASEKKLDIVKKELRVAQLEAGRCTSLQEQKEAQVRIKALEAKIRKARSGIWEIEDSIAEKRDLLIKELENKMAQKLSVKSLFMIRWKIV